jgi:hypothetical protein
LSAAVRREVRFHLLPASPDHRGGWTCNYADAYPLRCTQDHGHQSPEAALACHRAFEAACAHQTAA